MPTYVYECTACSEQTELIQKATDAPLEACPECGCKVRKLLFPVGIVFKGSGFHVNDYAKPGRGKDSESSSESKPADSSQKADKKEPAASTS